MKPKLKPEHLNPFLIYEPVVQYKGILNGKELKDYDIDYKSRGNSLEIDFLKNDEPYNPPKEVIGLKTGYIKVVQYWKSGLTYRIGNTSMGLQTHNNTDDFKLVLRPLSDLGEIDTKEHGIIYPVDYFDNHTDALKINKELISMMENNYCDFHLPYFVMEMLFEYHFDVFGLIKKGLAVDINTLDTNPYK